MSDSVARPGCQALIFITTHRVAGDSVYTFNICFLFFFLFFYNPRKKTEAHNILSKQTLQVAESPDPINRPNPVSK
jgi:hypothetical protein